MKSKIALFAAIVLLVSTFAFSAPRVITGKVTDDNTLPLPGATVVVVGAPRGTITNSNGEYKIEVHTTDKEIKFSFIGFADQVIKIDEKSIINVQMKPSESSLEEVVVFGYSVQRKVSICGSIVSACNNMTIPPPSAQYYSADNNSESYGKFIENTFFEVSNTPLSTFSIDVDNASYSNVRRYINNGQKPPVDAVRIEEMINYFSYNYPQPQNNDPFSITTEYTQCPWNNKHGLMLVALQGKSIDKTNLPASNLVFLIDVSGSMSTYNKLPLVKQALHMLVNELRPQDKVAIVVYAGAAGLVLESTNGDNKEKIVNAINNLQSGGSTAGGAGIQLAYKVAQENAIKNGNNRIILATDGDFNVGALSNGEMEKLIENERNNGVYLTVLGFGMGNIKDDKLETIADKGNGNYAYIDNIQEARKVFINEFGGTLFTIAKDVKLQLEFNPDEVKSYRLIGYENRLLKDEDFNNDKKDAGELGSGHVVTALYEIVPAGTDEFKPGVDQLKYQKKEVKKNVSSPNNELLTIKLRYKKPDENASKLITQTTLAKMTAFNEASENVRFASSVAEFGMLLRNSDFIANGSIKQVVENASLSKGSDNEGYRSEFIRLVKAVDAMGFSELKKVSE